LHAFFPYFLSHKIIQDQKKLAIDFKDPVTLTVIFFLPYIALQLLPPPPAILKWFSPISWEV